MCYLPGKDPHRGDKKYKQKDEEFRAVEDIAQASAPEAGKIHDKKCHQEINKVAGFECKG
jgi:hypothetical protein